MTISAISSTTSISLVAALPGTSLYDIKLPPQRGGPLPPPTVAELAAVAASAVASGAGASGSNTSGNDTGNGSSGDDAGRRAYGSYGNFYAVA